MYIYDVQTVFLRTASRSMLTRSYSVAVVIVVVAAVVVVVGGGGGGGGGGGDPTPSEGTVICAVMSEQHDPYLYYQ